MSSRGEVITAKNQLKRELTTQGLYKDKAIQELYERLIGLKLSEAHLEVIIELIQKVLHVDRKVQQRVLVTAVNDAITKHFREKSRDR
jgi:hypothetical protein